MRPMMVRALGIAAALACACGGNSYEGSWVYERTTCGEQAVVVEGMSSTLTLGERDGSYSMTIDTCREVWEGFALAHSGSTVWFRPSSAPGHRCEPDPCGRAVILVIGGQRITVGSSFCQGDLQPDFGELRATVAGEVLRLGRHVQSLTCDDEYRRAD